MDIRAISQEHFHAELASARQPQELARTIIQVAPKHDDIRATHIVAASSPCIFKDETATTLVQHHTESVRSASSAVFVNFTA